MEGKAKNVDAVTTANATTTTTNKKDFSDLDRWGKVCTGCPYYNQALKPCDVCEGGTGRSNSTSDWDSLLSPRHELLSMPRRVHEGLFVSDTGVPKDVLAGLLDGQSWILTEVYLRDELGEGSAALEWYRAAVCRICNKPYGHFGPPEPVTGEAKEAAAKAAEIFSGPDVEPVFMLCNSVKHRRQDAVWGGEGNADVWVAAEDLADQISALSTFVAKGVVNDYGGTVVLRLLDALDIPHQTPRRWRKKAEKKSKSNNNN